MIVVSSVPGRYTRASALGMTAGIDPRSVMEWRRPGGTACVIVVSSVPGRYIPVASALGMTAGIDPRSVMEWRQPGGTACVIVVSSVPGRYTRGIRIRDDRRD